jgi:hypothetical protein
LIVFNRFTADSFDQAVEVQRILEDSPLMPNGRLVWQPT